MKITKILLFVIAFVASVQGSNAEEKDILYWVAPMDPNYRMDEPGKSPMGMDLVPVYASEDDGDDVGGLAVVSINAQTIQNMGVRTEKASMAQFGIDVRSYGLVTEDVRKTHAISGRVAGWIEDLKITAVGDEVKKDDLLFTLYSPDLVSAQQDYIAALATGIKGRINSSAKRLKSFGVGSKALEQIKSKRKKLEYLPFYTETDGIVSHLMVSQGSYIKPGVQIATIQNYSSVWIDVSVAEKDLEFLSKDSKATVILPNLGNIKRRANIDYIHPTINPESRTGQVRLVLDNPEGKLKPGAYADVVFETNIEKRLSIPSEAILKSSDGDFVVVALGEGKFQPRKIEVGITSKGHTEILSGAKKGDDIVVSSQFLIDSESALRESFRKMGSKKEAREGGEHAHH